LSRHEAFSLKRGEALDIIREVRGALTGWEGILRRSGARERDIESVRWSFEGFRTRYPDIPKK